MKLRGDVWWFDGYVDGKRVRKSLGTTDKKEAKRKEAELLAGVTEVASKKSIADYGPTLGEAYKKAKREYKPWRDSPDVRTIDKNRRAIEDYFTADRKLSSIDREAINGFIEQMTKEGKAGSTINQRVSQLSVLFNEALDNWGYDKLVKPRIVRAKVAEGRQRRFTNEEVAEAIERLQKAPKDLYADVADLIKVLADTGMRLNECLSLTRANFSLPEKQIVLWVTKNKQPRGVPMTPRVVDVLTSRAHLSKPFGMLSETMATRAWRWVREEMGFADDPEFVMHTLRHTVGSRLADANVSAPLIQQMLGHKSLKTTQKYIHVSASGLRQVADILAATGAPACDQNCDQSVSESDQKGTPGVSSEAA